MSTDMQPYKNESTALIPAQIAEAMDKAMAEVEQFIESDSQRAKMVYVLTQQVARNEDLQRCEPASFALAIYRMFELGLDPRGINEAWLVPYKGKATLMPGYGGVRKIAMQSPEAEGSPITGTVHVNDTYDIDLQNGKPLHRRPSRFKPRGCVEGYYASMPVKGGQWVTVEMSVDEVKAHRDRYSMAKKKEIWQENRRADGTGPSTFDGMAMKTCLRMLCHPRNLQMSPAAQEVLNNEEAMYAPRPGDAIDIEGHEVKTPTNAENEQNIIDMFGGVTTDSAIDDPPGEVHLEPKPAPEPVTPDIPAWTGADRQELEPRLAAFLEKGMTIAQCWNVWWQDYSLAGDLYELPADYVRAFLDDFDKPAAVAVEE